MTTKQDSCKALDAKLRRMFPKVRPLMVGNLPGFAVLVSWGNLNQATFDGIDEAERYAARTIMGISYGVTVSGGKSRRGREVTILAQGQPLTVAKLDAGAAVLLGVDMARGTDIGVVSRNWPTFVPFTNEKELQARHQAQVNRDRPDQNPTQPDKIRHNELIYPSLNSELDPAVYAPLADALPVGRALA